MTRPAWRAALAAALAAALLLAACATPEERERRIDTSGHVVVLTAGSAPELTLRMDQELKISLAGEPTFGLEWTLAEMKPGVLAQQGPRSFEREGLVTNFGQGAGSDVFRFKPVAAGATTLKFDYRRPHSLEPASRSVSFTVSVQAVQ